LSNKIPALIRSILAAQNAGTERQIFMRIKPHIREGIRSIFDYCFISFPNYYIKLRRLGALLEIFGAFLPLAGIFIRISFE